MDHLATYRAGSIGYLVPRTRGTVDVWHGSDSRRYVFKPDVGETHGDVRLDIQSRFPDLRLTGRFPSYEVF